jgi:hypothetical protein
MSERRHPSVNSIGMRLMEQNSHNTHGKLRSSKGYGNQGNSQENIEIRKNFQHEVAKNSCCIYAYYMEVVTLNAVIAKEHGLTFRCPNKCDAWQHFQINNEPMTL